MLGWWRDWAGRVFVQQQAGQTGQARDSRRQELEAKLRPAVVPDDNPSQLGGGEIEIKLLLVHALYNFASAPQPAERDCTPWSECATARCCRVSVWRRWIAVHKVNISPHALFKCLPIDMHIPSRTGHPLTAKWVPSQDPRIAAESMHEMPFPPLQPVQRPQPAWFKIQNRSACGSCLPRLVSGAPPSS